jgi:hypothetical protein
MRDSIALRGMISILQDLNGTPLKLRAGLRRKEGIFSLLTRHLFLIPARRDEEPYRATIGRPAEAGLDITGFEFIFQTFE